MIGILVRKQLRDNKDYHWGISSIFVNKYYSKPRQQCLWFWLVTLSLYDADTSRKYTVNQTLSAVSLRHKRVVQGPWNVSHLFHLLRCLMPFAILLMFSRIMNWCYGRNGSDALHYMRLSDSIWYCLILMEQGTSQLLYREFNFLNCGTFKVKDSVDAN